MHVQKEADYVLKVTFLSEIIADKFRNDLLSENYWDCNSPEDVNQSLQKPVMKRIVVSFIAVSVILCAASCQKSDKCKCTTRIETSSGKTETTSELPRSESKSCKDLNSKVEVGSGTTTVTCVDIYE